MSAFLLEEKRLLQGQAGKAGCCEHHLCCKHSDAKGARSGLSAGKNTSPRPKAGISAQEEARNLSPSRPCGLTASSSWAMQTPGASSGLSRTQGVMHRGGHRGSGDVCTSPEPTSPRMVLRGPSSVGPALGCQAMLKPHPFKAEKETAGSTRLRVTRVTQAGRHKLHTLQVTFVVMGGGLSEAV